MGLWWRGVDSGSMDADAPNPDDDEGAVRPEELDFSDDRRVVELDDRRYVVATANEEAPSPPEDADESAETADDSDDGGSGAEGDDGRPDRAAARKALVEYVEGREPRHGFVVVGSFDGEVDGAEAFADDLPAVFREFVEWYATNVDTATSPAEVLGILLMAADVPVQYPARALERLLSAHDLSADDSIDDLLCVAREEGLRLPPADE